MATFPAGRAARVLAARGRAQLGRVVAADREAQRLIAAPAAEFSAELNQASGGVLGELTDAAARGAFPLQSAARSEVLPPSGRVARRCRAHGSSARRAGHEPRVARRRLHRRRRGGALAAGEDPGDFKVLRRYERERKGENLQMLLALDALHRAFRLPAAGAPLRAFGFARWTLAARRSGSSCGARWV